MSDITNAKDEFIKIIKGLPKVKCALIYYEAEGVSTLKVGHSIEDWVKFTYSLDFEYDSGWGGQNLFGVVWFEDGSWLERAEYDGSEWWKHKICPVIPEELL